MKVLVVEDDVKLAGLLHRILALDGIAADVATTADEALALAAGRHYDALVVDWMLPGMDGLELCRRLRRGGLQVPVVVISARDDLSARDLHDAGADQFLAKPFAVAELEDRIRGPRTVPAWTPPGRASSEEAPPRAGRGRFGPWHRSRRMR